MIEDIKFEIQYFFNKIRSNFYSFIQGIKNLWNFKELVWNYRWYDYSDFINFQRYILNDMRLHWHKDTHYVFDWNERLLLERLVDILDEIEYIQEEMPEDMTWTEQEEKVQQLFQEYGELLYQIKDQERNDNGKIYKYRTNNIQKLWD